MSKLEDRMIASYPHAWRAQLPRRPAHELKFRSTAAVGARIRTRISRPRPKLMWYPVNSSHHGKKIRQALKTISAPEVQPLSSTNLRNAATNNRGRLSLVSGHAFRRCALRDRVISAARQTMNSADEC